MDNIVKKYKMQVPQNSLIGVCTDVYLLIRNTPEHDVVQQGDLLGQLHGRQRLKTLCLRTVCLQAYTQAYARTHTRTHTHTHTQTNDRKKKS